MNIYAVSATMPVLEEYTPEGTPMETEGEAVALIAAETRGQARAEFAHWMTYLPENSDHGDFEFTDPMRIHLWRKNVEGVERGVLGDEDERQEEYWREHAWYKRE